MRKKAAPELVECPPIRLGAFSNGEYFHEQTALERKIEREILAQANEKARRLGMERREFLASAMGMATSLSVLNLASSCGSERDGAQSAADGGYQIPPEATMDCALAEAIVNGQNEFIFDIQTHHIDNEGSWRTTNPASGATLATLVRGAWQRLGSSDERPRDGSARHRKTAQVLRPRSCVVGLREYLARLAATADRSVSRIPDLEAVSRDLWLSRAYPRGQSQEIEADRPDIIALRSTLFEALSATC